MKTLGEKSHDVAVALLPKALEEAGEPCLVKTKKGYDVNTDVIFDMYNKLNTAVYDKLFKQYVER